MDLNDYTFNKKLVLENTNFPLSMSMEEDADSFWNAAPRSEPIERATKKPRKSTNTRLQHEHKEGAKKKSKCDTSSPIQSTTLALNLTTLDEIDTPSNPYLEIAEDVYFTQKVTFIDYRDGINVHEYNIIDSTGAYSNHITSVSAMLSTYKTWTELSHIDEEMERELDQSRLESAIVSTKFDDTASTGYRYNSTVPIVSQIYTDYFNNLCTTPIPPMNFGQRREYFLSLQEKGGKKEVYQFVKSSAFEEFEEWIYTNCPTFTPFKTVDDALLLARWVYNPQYPDYEHIQHDHLRRVFTSLVDEEISPMTGYDVMQAYKIGQQAGTMLHNYLECRLLDVINNTCEIAHQLHPMRDKIDYVQAEDFINNHGFKFIHLEYRLASYRHKICGSVDAISQLEDGTLVIHDHKRTPAFNSRPWFKKDGIVRPDMGKEALSSETVKYAIQMAGYRKLLILNGTAENPVRVSNIAYLHIFHPTLDTWKLVEIDLSAKMREDVNHYFCKLGVEEHGTAALSLSPIEVVELLFSFFEKELSRILRKRR